MEHQVRINKAAAALVTGVLMWTVYGYHSPDTHHVTEELMHHLAEISEILFFLLGAMTIVELIDVHGGFALITDRIKTRDKRRLLWIICLMTFFMSAALDNLTTAIVMVAMLQKLIQDRQQRLTFSAMVVIAANAGGAWSPMGDVTTTMLWIQGQISAGAVILKLFLPSLVCLLVPLLLLSFTMKGKLDVVKRDAPDLTISLRERLTVLLLGLGGLLFVPLYKTLFHMPPYMGMLLSLGVLWMATELMHGRKEALQKKQLTAAHALERVDTPSILFFLGILISVGALQSSHILQDFSSWVMASVPDQRWVIGGAGVLSAIVDNVPLVKAAQGIYSMDTYPQDHALWHFLAYTSGTGGSMLIIGSAAGVAVMGMEKMDFFWYLKRITGLAALGFVAGALLFLLLTAWG
jgi:Na+/H+ antiporter NhaD/arsenite permease-like protein